MCPQPYKKSSTHRIRGLIGLLSLLVTSFHSIALESDKFQPIDIAADSALLDDRAGKAIYQGNVILTQGSLKIIADQLTIETSTEGKVEKVIATGELAEFSQTPNPNDKPIEAEAHTVEYYVSQEKIVLTVKAKVVQNDNLFEGNIIEYDIKAQKLQAHGKAVTSSEDGNAPATNGRVKMVLQPQTEESTPAESNSQTGADNTTQAVDVTNP